MAQPL